MAVIQVMCDDNFTCTFGFCNNFLILCTSHANIPYMTTNMTAFFQKRGHVSVYVHVEQEIHPATVAGMGNTLSSIAQEAYASAW